jgi:hypothetical protein
MLSKGERGCEREGDFKVQVLSVLPTKEKKSHRIARIERARVVDAPLDR